MIPVQAQDSSSVTRESSNAPQPLPPNSVGIVMFTKPTSRALSCTSVGKRASLSQVAASGRISLRANSRAVCLISFCSSVSSKFMV